MQNRTNRHKRPLFAKIEIEEGRAKRDYSFPIFLGIIPKKDLIF